MPKLLVTGATGLLGNSIVRKLLSDGHAVRVLVRGNPTAQARAELAGLDVEYVTGELNDESAVDRAVAGCEAVIHSAAMIHIGYQRLAEATQVNVAGSRTIAEACLRHRARLAYISTVDTLPAAISPTDPLDETASGSARGRAKTACTYVITKQAAEREIIAASHRGLDVVILHPGFMLGPYDWKPSSGALMLTIRRVPYVVAPRGTASVCDSRDVAAAVISSLSLGRSGQHYILAGKNIPYPDLCRQIVEVIGRPKRVIRMGPIIPAAARVVDLWNRLSGSSERLFNGAAIAMGSLHHAYSSAKAEQELNYNRRPLEETLGDAWEWLQAHH